MQVGLRISEIASRRKGPLRERQGWDVYGILAKLWMPSRNEADWRILPLETEVNLSENAGKAAKGPGEPKIGWKPDQTKWLNGSN